MTDTAVTVQSLTKVFPIPFRRKSIVAVRDLDLSIRPGEIYGLLGPNGSGKSTTLKIILGLLSPTRGRTEIFGIDSREVRSRRSVGFLPENPYFYKFLTGAETLRFFGKLAGLFGRNLEERIDGTLASVSLTEARDRRLSTYSKGMLQRIGLAQALIHQPRILILDEPTAGVDPAGSRDISALILKLKQDGVTILLSSHLLTQVQQICDRVGILSAGRLVREGALPDLVTAPGRTEIVLENATDEVMRQIETAIGQTKARIVQRKPASKTLEELFLEETEGKLNHRPNDSEKPS
jgi:ABC-2 type transport system ATP-binding protein